jgi:hypothetical protein
MSYSKISLDVLKTNFGVSNEVVHLFDSMEGITPSAYLKNALDIAKTLPIRSEKAKSEAIVFPVLVELRNRNDNFFTIYSGDNLPADPKRGLDGECDFILSKDTRSFDISYPIIQVVEAKKNDLELGVPQCAAQLYGAKVFNQKKGVELEKIYGCVTTGNEWLFMVLEGNQIRIDNEIYYLDNLNEILGVFQFIIDYYKKQLG